MFEVFAVVLAGEDFPQSAVHEALDRCGQMLKRLGINQKTARVLKQPVFRFRSRSERFRLSRGPLFMNSAANLFVPDTGFSSRAIFENSKYLNTRWAAFLIRRCVLGLRYFFGRWSARFITVLLCSAWRVWKFAAAM